jgi:hypothetical protein
MTLSISEYIWFIIDILKILIPYYIIISTRIKYVPSIIVTTDILYTLWIAITHECTDLSVNAKTLNSLVLFNIFTTLFLCTILIFHSIWIKKYLPILWITIPCSLMIMKGFSCALEDIINAY